MFKGLKYQNGQIKADELEGRQTSLMHGTNMKITTRNISSGIKVAAA